MNYEDILNFWFSDEAQPNWFAKNEQFDQSLTEKFSEIGDKIISTELIFIKS